MAACRIHYEIYDNEDDKLLKLTEDNLDRLKDAKKCRFELGGNNIKFIRYIVTLCNMHKESEFLYHQKCYKKFTMAISVCKKKSQVQATEPSRSRVKRTGNLGKTLFPKYCMVCKHVTITVKRQKQHVRLLELKHAEKAIEEAAKLRQDNEMLAAIQGVTSLRAAEFQIHSKCQKDYTRICPTKAKRAKSDSDCTGENKNDSEIVEELGEDDFNIYTSVEKSMETSEIQGMFFYIVPYNAPILYMVPRRPPIF